MINRVQVQLIVIIILVATAGGSAVPAAIDPIDTSKAKFATVVSDCLRDLFPDSTGAKNSDSNQIEIFGQGNTIVCRHHWVIYNCCAKPSLEFDQDGWNATVVEWENVKTPCFCTCPFNMEGKINDLPDGTYTVRLYQGDTGQLLATQTVTLPADGFWYLSSECLKNTQPTQTTPADSLASGEIRLQIGPDYFRIDHRGVEYNCCATMVVVLKAQDNRFDFFETETYPKDAGPCHCVCPFDLTMGMGGLAPGEYEINVFNADGSIAYFHDHIIISPAGFTDTSSGCLSARWAKNAQILIDVVGRTVVVKHIAAMWNCCAKPGLHLRQTGSVLDFIELEHLSGGGCYCRCPYNLEGKTADLPDGTYLVNVINGETGTILYSKKVTIGIRKYQIRSISSRRFSP